MTGSGIESDLRLQDEASKVVLFLRRHSIRVAAVHAMDQSTAWSQFWWVIRTGSIA